MLEQTVMSLLDRGEETQARALLEDHLKKRPSDAVANKLMAMIYGAHGQDDKALFYIQRAAYAAPKDGFIRFMLGNVLMSLRKYKESAAAYRECCKLAPGDVGACDGLAKCLISLGQYDQACQAFEAAVKANPEDAIAYGNYANALVLIAKVKEAVDVARRGLARLPNDPALLEFIAYSANFPSGTDNIELRRLHQRLGAEYLKQRGGPSSVFPNTRDPDRPLRVGFMSGDYSLHACSLFMKGPLLNFDRARVIPYCFSTTRKEDGGEAPFKAGCEWRDITDCSIDQTNAAIRADQIDILIECSGLTQGHRLKALIPRAAPVQCTWLGYPNTTGVPTIDYRIVDALTDPPENDEQVSEKLARIPGCFLCFNHDAMTLPPVLTPATVTPYSTAPITFGSFNRMTKVTTETVAVWCRVLAAVPNSRMLLKLRIMSDELRRDTIELFTSRGVDPSRIDMVPFAIHSDDHARMYAQMDIALDAFPYNGTTTTCEATWMGVPVVVLEGDSHRSRVGVSLNTAMGLTDLIARDVDEYVRIASRLAADRGALAALKLSLRERMAASPLCNARDYARRFENVLRTMWQTYCHS